MRGFILRYSEPGVFDPDTVRVLTEAFDEAWEKLKSSKAPYATGEYVEAGRTIIARYIIKSATAGERNKHKPVEGALVHIASRKLRTASTGHSSGGIQ